MSIPVNKDLYEKAKQIVYKQYDKPSAYRSGALVKKYKELGGKYKQDKNKNSIDDKPLKRWFNEKWIDIGNQSYPVLRPTKRVSSQTPLLATEIDPTNLKKQISKKQIIKDNNLPPFKKNTKRYFLLS